MSWFLRVRLANRETFGSVKFGERYRANAFVTDDASSTQFEPGIIIQLELHALNCLAWTSCMHIVIGYSLLKVSIRVWTSKRRYKTLARIESVK